MEHDASPALVSKFSRAEDQFRLDGLRRRQRGAANSPPASASTPIGSTSRSASCREVSDGARNSYASCSAGVTCCCSTNRPTTSTPTRALVAEVPAVSTVAPSWSQPRPRSARRSDHARPAPRPTVEERTGTLVEYKGTYSQYLDAREGDEERAAKLAERQEAEIARLQTLADTARHPEPGQGTRAQTLDQRRAKLEAAEGRRTRRSGRRSRCGSPSRRRPVARCSPRRLYKSFGALDVFGDVPSTSAGVSGCS